jgi:hypothetical protein
MITPIRTMTIEQICERKDDLLIGSDDVKDLARNDRNKAIDEFVEKLSQEFIRTDEDGNLYIFAWITDFREIAEQMKGEQ